MGTIFLTGSQDLPYQIIFFMKGMWMEGLRILKTTNQISSLNVILMTLVLNVPGVMTRRVKWRREYVVNY